MLTPTGCLLMAMLEKRIGMQVLGDDVFVNVAGGMTIDEPAADLGIVAAIASSFRNVPVDERVCGVWRSWPRR